MKIHIIMHESFESPAAIADWGIQKGHSLSYTRLYCHERLPDSTRDFDFLIVMGGPQSPATTTAECSYFNAAAEIQLIKDAILKKKLILGVCLGAQLIGEAYGARFEHSPYKEIGKFPVVLTDEAKSDPVFAKFPSIFTVGHWHGDMPGLTATSKVLAKSAGCPRQIVQYEPGVYGFQCHFEFTKEAIANMILHCQAELENLASSPFIQTIKQLKENNYSEMNRLLFIFLDEMESLYHQDHS